MADSPSPHRKSTAERGASGGRRPTDLGSSPMRYHFSDAAMKRARAAAPIPLCNCRSRSARSSALRSMSTTTCWASWEAWSSGSRAWLLRIRWSSFASTPISPSLISTAETSRSLTWRWRRSISAPRPCLPIFTRHLRERRKRPSPS